MYIMTPFYTAVESELSIHLMNHLYPDMLKVNSRDDITRWWEVIDRTTGEVVPVSRWSYDDETLRNRSLLMCVSRKRENIPRSVCADLLRKIHM